MIYLIYLIYLSEVGKVPNSLNCEEDAAVCEKKCSICIGLKYVQNVYRGRTKKKRRKE